MAGKVVSLGGASIPEANEPEPAVVQYLETLLAEARAGRIRAVATCEVTSSGSVCHGWALGPLTDVAMGGAMLRLQHALATHLYKRGK